MRPVGAHVVKCAQRGVATAYNHDVLVEHAVRDVTAELPEVACMADHLPCAIEDLFLLTLEYFVVHAVARRQGISVFGVSGDAFFTGVRRFWISDSHRYASS